MNLASFENINSLPDWVVDDLLSNLHLSGFSEDDLGRLVSLKNERLTNEIIMHHAVRLSLPEKEFEHLWDNAQPRQKLMLTRSPSFPKTRVKEAIDMIKNAGFNEATKMMACYLIKNRAIVLDQETLDLFFAAPSNLIKKEILEKRDNFKTTPDQAEVALNCDVVVRRALAFRGGDFTEEQVLKIIQYNDQHTTKAFVEGFFDFNKISQKNLNQLLENTDISIMGKLFEREDLFLSEKQCDDLLSRTCSIATEALCKEGFKFSRKALDNFLNESISKANIDVNPFNSRWVAIATLFNRQDFIPTVQQYQALGGFKINIDTERHEPRWRAHWEEQELKERFEVKPKVRPKAL